MKKFLCVLLACVAFLGCGRDDPEAEMISASMDKLYDIQDALEDEEYAEFLELALRPTDREALGSDFAEKLKSMDTATLVQLLEGMLEAESYVYIAEGDTQIAYALPEPVAEAEVVTMIPVDGEWFLYQARKMPAAE